MWFRLSAHDFIPGGELVGFFRPGPAGGTGKENEKTGTVVVLRDGRSVASPFGLKVLTRRYNEEKKSLLSLWEKEKVTQRETGN